MLQINKPTQEGTYIPGTKDTCIQDHNTQDAPTVQYNWQNIIP